MTKKTIIIGAGLGGLVNGILLKIAKPEDDVVIYDGNKIPGGFCTAFDKIANIDNERVKYNINIPLLVSDFGPDEPFDVFLKYIGVQNLEWTIKEKLFQFYPLDQEPFLVTDNCKNELADLVDDKKEKKAIKKFFENIEKFFGDIFHKSYVNPTAFQAIKMLIKMPKTVLTLLNSQTYLEYIDKLGIKTPVVKEILSAAEAFFGVDVDKVSTVGEMCLLQSFLENNAEQPTNDYDFQDLSDRLADRFRALGGLLELKTEVASILFDKKKAIGVKIGNENINADNVIMAVAQDRIEGLVSSGEHIGKIKSLLKGIRKLPYANSDYYCYYLIDKKVIDDNPRFTDIAYHIYRLPEGMDDSNWKLAMWVPNKLYNDKYYMLCLVMVEQDQKKVDEWIELRKKNYKEYQEKKKIYEDKFLRDIQAVEPIFKENPPVKCVLSFSPASYLPYGSRVPISGLAQTPENFGASRMSPMLLDNLFISGGACFSAGVWGAMAGGWQGFVNSYKNIYGVKIGNHDVFYRPGLKNLP